MLHLRHSRWSESGVWQRIFATLSQDADNEYVMIDPVIVRAHQRCSGVKGEAPEKQAIGLSHELGLPWPTTVPHPQGSVVSRNLNFLERDQWLGVSCRS